VCTRIFWSNNPQAKVVARTMDWEISDEPKLHLSPRGLQRTQKTGDHLKSWQSRWGTISLSAWGVAVSDGLNEQGLAAHCLYLESTRYPDADARPAIENLMWVQYVLDNFATVSEAVAALDTIRVFSVAVHNQHIGMHFALEDPTGDSAILEYIDGKLVVHHDPQYQVVANDPIYALQLSNLKNYKPFGGTQPPPGDIVSLHRFVRASYFLHYLPEPHDYAEAVAGVIQVAHNVAVPSGAPYDQFGAYPTWWISVADVTTRTYYFESTLSPNIIWVELNNLNFNAGAPVQVLDPRNPALVGEISRAFQPAPPLF
jgi:penicillin V acylase-like amidase (Ntn superfamily)